MDVIFESLESNLLGLELQNEFRNVLNFHIRMAIYNGEKIDKKYLKYYV